MFNVSTIAQGSTNTVVPDGELTHNFSSRLGRRSCRPCRTRFRVSVPLWSMQVPRHSPVRPTTDRLPSMLPSLPVIVSRVLRSFSPGVIKEDLRKIKSRPRDSYGLPHTSPLRPQSLWLLLQCGWWGFTFHSWILTFAPSSFPFFYYPQPLLFCVLDPLDRRLISLSYSFSFSFPFGPQSSDSSLSLRL